MWYHILNVPSLRCAQISVMCHQHLLICHQCCDLSHHLWCSITQSFAIKAICLWHTITHYDGGGIRQCARTWNAVPLFCKAGQHRKQSNPPLPTQFNSNLSEKQDQAIEFLMWSSFVFSAFFCADSNTLGECSIKHSQVFWVRNWTPAKTWRHIHGVLKIIGVENKYFETCSDVSEIFAQFS